MFILYILSDLREIEQGFMQYLYSFPFFVAQSRMPKVNSKAISKCDLLRNVGMERIRYGTYSYSFNLPEKTQFNHIPEIDG